MVSPDGFEPPPQRLRAARAALTLRRDDWSGRRVTLSSLGLGGAACFFHTPAAHLRTSVEFSKIPAITAVWRQRQDSNSDPRVLEARMLPLHHAAVVHCATIVLTDTRSLRSDAGLPACEAKTKKAF